MSGDAVDQSNREYERQLRRERDKPVHFEGMKTTPCGRDMRMGANIFTTDQIGNVTCRKCLSRLKTSGQIQSVARP